MSDQPPSDGEGEGPQRIALPKNIAQTLTYLDDIDLEALRGAVENEVRRRRAEKGIETELQAADAAPAERPRVRRGGAILAKQDGSSLPMGKASLIRASAQSGMKPQAIARALRLPLAEVTRVLKSEAKPKR